MENDEQHNEAEEAEQVKNETGRADSPVDKQDEVKQPEDSAQAPEEAQVQQQPDEEQPPQKEDEKEPATEATKTDDNPQERTIDSRPVSRVRENDRNRYNDRRERKPISSDDAHHQEEEGEKQHADASSSAQLAPPLVATTEVQQQEATKDDSAPKQQRGKAQSRLPKKRAKKTKPAATSHVEAKKKSELQSDLTANGRVGRTYLAPIQALRRVRSCSPKHDETTCDVHPEASTTCSMPQQELKASPSASQPDKNKKTAATMSSVSPQQLRLQREEEWDYTTSVTPQPIPTKTGTMCTPFSPSKHITTLMQKHAVTPTPSLTRHHNKLYDFSTPAASLYYANGQSPLLTEEEREDALCALLRRRNLTFDDETKTDNSDQTTETEKKKEKKKRSRLAVVDGAVDMETRPKIAFPLGGRCLYTGNTPGSRCDPLVKWQQQRDSSNDAKDRDVADAEAGMTIKEKHLSRVYPTSLVTEVLEQRRMNTELCRRKMIGFFKSTRARLLQDDKELENLMLEAEYEAEMRERFHIHGSGGGAMAANLASMTISRNNNSNLTSSNKRKKK